jgi:starch synthase
MKVLFATPELAPWVKTGGLGDIASALPAALRKLRVDVRVLVPWYPALRDAFPDAVIVARLDAPGGTLPAAALRAATAADGTPLLMIDSACYARPGNPYLGPDGHDWPDNLLRFGLLSRVAAWLGSAACPEDLRCDIVHCNDWQTGLAPAYLRYLPGGVARSLVTIHNLAFQGLFDRGALDTVGLPANAWAVDGVEYYGQLCFLKAGLQQADAITTVSPGYAREIQTEEEGMGMAGLLRHRAARLSGILNGIDTATWDPAHDALIDSPYDARRLKAKQKNKAALQAAMGLPPRGDLPLLGVVSRLTHQKGLDLLPPLADALVALPAQLVVLGSGERPLEQVFIDLAQRHPESIATRLGFDERLAHRIEAGADIFLMPSRFEPCGLNQMYSLRYGTPPIVRATGGLADTVLDADRDSRQGNGFVFRDTSSGALLDAIRRSIAAWSDAARWQRIQRRGMATDFSWKEPAQRYAEIYRSLTAHDRRL